MLSEKEQTEILQNFPYIELSYEIITHKKVFSCQFAMAIPEGKKFFAWFSKYNNRNVCFFMEIATKIKQISKLHVEYVNDFYNETILYGTIFETNNMPFFCIETILQKDGTKTSHLTIDMKLKNIHTFLEKNHLKIPYLNKFITFGVPLMCPSFSQEMNMAIKDLPYKISELHFYTRDKPKHYYSLKYVYQSLKNIPVKSIVFNVKPDLQNDIYHLYAYDESINSEYLYDTAYISDYKTSVMMNGLFRNIKENINLDALEESDDEEEFENDKIDKFVDLKKSHYMECLYNNKFKKWSPISVIENGTSSMVIRKNKLIR